MKEQFSGPIAFLLDRARVRRMLVETVRRLLVDRRAMTVRRATIAGLLVAAAPGIVGLWM